MAKPAVWNGDPQCGHEVTCAYQTHYCTYIRVPRLLTLQAPRSADELLLICALQSCELWLKVMVNDLRAALEADPATRAPEKLLARGNALLALLERQVGLVETIAVREIGLRVSLAPQGVGHFVPLTAASTDYGLSEQLHRLVSLASRLPPHERATHSPLSLAAREYRARLRSFAPRFRRLLKATITITAGVQDYADWLHLPAILALQKGVKAGWTVAGQPPSSLWQPEAIGPHEAMFIVVHQCFELWFKVILDACDRAIPLLAVDRVESGKRLLCRVALILRFLVEQIRIPTTMLPQDFLMFREQRKEWEGEVLCTGLSPASGTESYQFREIEIVAGLRDDAVFRAYLSGSEKLPVRLLTPRQAERMQQPSLWDAFQAAVKARGVEELDDLFLPSSALTAHADLADLADTLVEIDDAFHTWRLGHLSMVERMIGGKSGTGYLGPEYLAETAGVRMQSANRIFAMPQVRPRLFEPLWAVRTRLGTRR